MPTIDAEGMLHLFNRHPTGLVAIDELMADATAHEIERGHAAAALIELLARGTLVKAPGNKLQRPD
jgi:hypothetical protein